MSFDEKYDPPVMMLADLTCRRAGCVNEGVEIRMLCTSEGLVLCGGCGNQITDISPAPSGASA